jgi:hypothetical protein
MTAKRRLLLALLAGTTVVLLGCRDSGPLLEGPPPTRAPQTSLLDPLVQPTGLLYCSPLPYDSVTQTIGPDGGTIVVGTHSLSIPAGALDSAITITAVAPSDTVNRVVFQPSGLVFQQPASLRMSYANCNLLGWTLPKQIAYVDDVLGILYYLLSVDNPVSQTVTGRLDHFSEYAIAW